MDGGAARPQAPGEQSDATRAHPGAAGLNGDSTASCGLSLMSLIAPLAITGAQDGGNVPGAHAAQVQVDLAGLSDRRPHLGGLAPTPDVGLRQATVSLYKRS
jgi:hypothetical protein